MHPGISVLIITRSDKRDASRHLMKCSSSKNQYTVNKDTCVRAAPGGDCECVMFGLRGSIVPSIIIVFFLNIFWLFVP